MSALRTKPLPTTKQYSVRTAGPTPKYVRNFYSQESNYPSSSNRITPATGRSTYTDEYPYTNSSRSTYDQSVTRSDDWSTSRFGNSTIGNSKSGCSGCLKSLECRYIAIGMVLGLLASLGALIPVLVLWQTSTNGTGSAAATATNPSSVAVGIAPSLDVWSSIKTCGPYSCDQQVNFTSNMTITKLVLTVTVQRTGNATYKDAYPNHSYMNATYVQTNKEIIYSFFILPNQELQPNSYTCNVQFDLSNSNHTSSLDTYSIEITNKCGITSSTSGNFP